MTDAPAQPAANPWDQQYQLKETQAPDPGVLERFTNVVSNAVSNVKQGKMPWETNYKEKSREITTPSKGHMTETFEQVMDRLFVQESGNRHVDESGNLITSPKGAQGVSQVMPKTGSNPGFGVTPLQNQSEEEYRRFGRDYLQAMLKEFSGDFNKALAAYNAGPKAVQKAVARYGDNWLSNLPSETQNYVGKIMRK